jgi:hypothetical protein
MTTVGLPDTATYTTTELISCLIAPSACTYGSQGRLHPLCIRHAVQTACSETLRWVQFIQFDQHKRLVLVSPQPEKRKVAGSIPALATTNIPSSAA